MIETALMIVGGVVLYGWGCWLLGRWSVGESKGGYVHLSTSVNEGWLLTNVRVVDGDTVEADIHLGLNFVLEGEKIRAADYDAWECSKRRRTVEITDDEVRKGKRAKAYLEGLLSAGEIRLKSTGNRDAYGRLLGVLSHNGIDVRYQMSLQGHLRPSELG